MPNPVNVQRLRRNDDLSDAGFPAEIGSFLLLPDRDKRRRGSHGKGTVSETIVSDLQEKGRIYAAGKGDCKASQLRKAAAERIVFCVQ